MGINITQFAPPGTVSKLVWDEDMEPGAGKIFKGDLLGDVTGDVTGDLTGVVRGSLLGYLSRNGVYSASSGALVVPASSSVGNNPVTVNIDWNVSYAIVGNTQKCYIADPCNIPVVLSALESWQNPDGASYAKSYTSDGVLIDSITDSGDLNIYGASYIVLNGGMWNEDGNQTSGYRTMSVADAYIDAGTSLILGDDTPPDGPKVSKLVWDADMAPAVGKKFKGALEGDVTGNVTGKTTYVWSVAPRDVYAVLRTAANSTTQVYQLSPGDAITGTIRCYINSSTPDLDIRLLCISHDWYVLLHTPLSYTAETFTLPEGTNGIYILNNSDTYGSIYMSRFTIT